MIERVRAARQAAESEAQQKAADELQSTVEQCADHAKLLDELYAWATSIGLWQQPAFAGRSRWIELPEFGYYPKDGARMLRMTLKLNESGPPSANMAWSNSSRQYFGNHAEFWYILGEVPLDAILRAAEAYANERHVPPPA